MKIFKNMGDRLRSRCDGLNPGQRRRVVLLLSILYLILTLAVLLSAFLPDGNRPEEEHIRSFEGSGLLQDSPVMPELLYDEPSNTADHEQAD